MNGKTQEKLKNAISYREEYAKSKGYDSWQELWSHNDSYDFYIPEMMERFAESFAKQEAKKACEKQRDLCATEWNFKHGYKFSDAYDETVMSEIRNAPEPKI